jgi:hypothetical protein
MRRVRRALVDGRRMTGDHQRMLTPGEAAQRLNGALSRQAIRRMAATGEIAGVRRTPTGRYLLPEWAVNRGDERVRRSLRGRDGSMRVVSSPPRELVIAAPAAGPRVVTTRPPDRVPAAEPEDDSGRDTRGRFSPTPTPTPTPTRKRGLSSA